jgi:hypothetical protein
MTKNGELGALWEKSGAHGPYMTGKISGVSVVLFKNDKKEAGSNQPDWRVLEAKKKDALPADDSHTQQLAESDVPF